MPTKATTVDAYIAELPEDRQPVMTELHNRLAAALPPGFDSTISYGMITYVVPHSTYPAGYHCDPKQALPFLSIASQKGGISVYHMGLYASPNLMDWFTNAYAEQVKGKLDIGKSCIRFKKPEQIPFALLEELAGKMSPADWIGLYEEKFRKK